jgi:hypothetical protein
MFLGASFNCVNDFNAIYSDLITIDDVQKVNVIENDTNATVDSVPAHSIECQVVGGTDDEVAQSIFDNKASGTGTSGNTTVSILDLFKNPHNIKFNRPDQKDMQVRVTISLRDNVLTLDSTLAPIFKLETQEYVNNLLVGANVSYTAIFAIWGNQTNFNIDKLELSDDGATWVETNFPITDRQYATLDDIANIGVI